MKKFFYLLGLCFFFSCATPSAFAWNTLGHRVVGEIAYDNLTPQAKKQILAQLKVLKPYYPSSVKVSTAAAWADWIKSDTDAYDTWHYINIPYTQDSISPPSISNNNVVWAILQSESVLENKKANALQKSIFLRFLLHFVGDIHQPMHTLSLYNKQFPTGDQGGNLYLIKTPQESNLHELGDDGFGFLELNNAAHQSADEQVKSLAHQLEREYPKKQFDDELKIQDPQVWAEESHAIGVKYAYTVPYGQTPSQLYMKTNGAITKRQLALAGYRLAQILNSLYG